MEQILENFGKKQEFPHISDGCQLKLKVKKVNYLVSLIGCKQSQCKRKKENEKKEKGRLIYKNTYF